MKSERELEALAGGALAAYELPPAELAFLGQSENATFKVSSAGKTYLLRLHLPRLQLFGARATDEAAIRYELQWLEALGRAGLPVQRPLRNRAKELVTRLEDSDGGKVYCSMLSWLEGEPYTREMESEDTVAQMGSLAGRLHLQASRWRPPKGFTRPRQEADYYESAMKALEPAVGDGRLAYADFRALQTSMEILIGLLTGVRKTHKSQGLIHADLHRGNFIHDQGRLAPIDFSFCCFGYFAADLGVCLGSVSLAHHGIFLEHYQRYFELPPDHERLIEGFFIAGHVATFALWVNDAQAQEALAQRVPTIAREFAARFNRDERFWPVWMERSNSPSGF